MFPVEFETLGLKDSMATFTPQSSKMGVSSSEWDDSMDRAGHDYNNDEF